MKKSAFRPYSLSQAKRYVLEVSKFLGIDYSAQKFNVAAGRAIEAKNYVYKDGVIQQRSGYEEKCKVKPYNYLVKPFNDDIPVSRSSYEDVKHNGVNFNGIWKFLAEDGKYHIIAHIGRLLYEIKNVDTENITVEPILYDNQSYVINGVVYFTCYEYEDFISKAFVGANRLWFLGGNKFMCIRYTPQGVLKIYPVANRIDSGDETEDTYIPTTTISITYANSRVARRQSYDYTNLLNMFRQNKCITGTGTLDNIETDTEYFEYTLDAPLLCKNQQKDMAHFSIVLEERGEINNA